MGEQTIEYFYNRIILSIKGMNYATWMNLKIVTLTERRQTNKQIKSTYVCFKMDKIPGKTNEFIVTKQISDALVGGQEGTTKMSWGNSYRDRQFIILNVVNCL